MPPEIHAVQTDRQPKNVGGVAVRTVVQLILMVQEICLPTQRAMKINENGIKQVDECDSLIALAYQRTIMDVITSSIHPLVGRWTVQIAMIQQIVKSEMIRGFEANFHSAAHDLLLSLRL